MSNNAPHSDRYSPIAVTISCETCRLQCQIVTAEQYARQRYESTAEQQRLIRAFVALHPEPAHRLNYRETRFVLDRGHPGNHWE